MDRENLKQGRIIKGYFSFYYVEADGVLWECRARGRFKKDNIDVLVGDLVLFNILDEKNLKGVIEEILPRKNRLIRPAISNVDQALIVVAFNYPEPDLWLVDRLLIQVKRQNIKPILVWNKSDLLDTDRQQKLMAQYEKAQVEQIPVCVKQNINVDKVAALLKDKATVVAGPSGVGKSSLLNAIEPGMSLVTGDISEKMERGKHTTRHVEWLRLSFGGFIADTPGFSNIYLPEGLTTTELQNTYEEFKEYIHLCKYTGCSHIKEKECGVVKALNEGKINIDRYNRYVTFYTETKENEKSNISSGRGRS